MVHPGDDIPGGCVVTIFTGVGTLDVIGRLALCCCSVMTARTVACDRIVVDPTGTPSGRSMTILTATTTLNVTGWLAGCRGAVVAGRPSACDRAVIELD